MPITIGATSADSGPAAFAAVVGDAVRAGAAVRVQVGDAICEIDGDLAAGLIGLLEAVGAGLSVDITSLPAELTTGQAADLLGVTRPTVIALVDRGALAATRIGTHRRLRTVDVLAYRDGARNERRHAVDEVVAVSEALGLYDQ